MLITFAFKKEQQPYREQSRKEAKSINESEKMNSNNFTRSNREKNRTLENQVV